MLEECQGLFTTSDVYRRAITKDVEFSISKLKIVMIVDGYVERMKSFFLAART